MKRRKKPLFYTLENAFELFIILFLSNVLSKYDFLASTIDSRTVIGIQICVEVSFLGLAYIQNLVMDFS